MLYFYYTMVTIYGITIERYAACYGSKRERLGPSIMNMDLTQVM